MIRISGNSGCGKTTAAQAAIDTNNPAHIVMGNDGDRWLDYKNDAYFRGKNKSNSISYRMDGVIRYLHFCMTTSQQLPKTLVLDESMDMNSLHILKRLFPNIIIVSQGPGHIPQLSSRL